MKNSLSRFVSLFLALTLILPNPVLALRAANIKERSALSGLEEGLIQSAGLEDGWKWAPWVAGFLGFGLLGLGTLALTTNQLPDLLSTSAPEPAQPPQAGGIRPIPLVSAHVDAGAESISFLFPWALNERSVLMTEFRFRTPEAQRAWEEYRRVSSSSDRFYGEIVNGRAGWRLPEWLGKQGYSLYDIWPGRVTVSDGGDNVLVEAKLGELLPDGAYSVTVVRNQGGLEERLSWVSIAFVLLGLGTAAFVADRWPVVQPEPKQPPSVAAAPVPDFSAQIEKVNEEFWTKGYGAGLDKTQRAQVETFAAGKEGLEVMIFSGKTIFHLYTDSTLKAEAERKAREENILDMGFFISELRFEPYETPGLILRDSMLPEFTPSPSKLRVEKTTLAEFLPVKLVGLVALSVNPRLTMEQITKGEILVMTVHTSEGRKVLVFA